MGRAEFQTQIDLSSNSQQLCDLGQGSPLSEPQPLRWRQDALGEGYSLSSSAAAVLPHSPQSPGHIAFTPQGLGPLAGTPVLPRGTPDVVAT